MQYTSVLLCSLFLSIASMLHPWSMAPGYPENSTQIAVSLESAFAKISKMISFNSIDREELLHQILSIAQTAIPFIAFVLGLTTLIISFATRKSHRNSERRAFGLLGLFIALNSLEAVSEALHSLTLPIAWMAPTLLVRISEPISMLYWRKSVSTCGGKDSDLQKVIDLVFVSVTLIWVVSPFLAYPLLSQQLSAFLKFNLLPWLALYVLVTALISWVIHTASSYPRRTASLLILLCGLIPPSLVFAQNRTMSSLLDGLLQYGLPLSLLMVFFVQILKRPFTIERMIIAGENQINDEITENSEELRQSSDVISPSSQRAQSLLARSIYATLYPKSIPGDSMWELATSRSRSSHSAAGFYDIYLNQSGSLDGFAYMNCDAVGLEGLVFTHIVQSELHRNYAPNSPLPQLFKTVHRKSIFAAEAVGSTMKGIIGRFRENRIILMPLSTQPLLLRRNKDGKVVAIRPSGAKPPNPPMGSPGISSGKMKSLTISMESNDVLMAYTESLMGLSSDSGEPLGTKRLAAALSDSKSLKAGQIVMDVISDIKKFCQPNAPSKPLCILVIKKR